MTFDKTAGFIRPFVALGSGYLITLLVHAHILSSGKHDQLANDLVSGGVFIGVSLIVHLAHTKYFDNLKHWWNATSGGAPADPGVAEALQAIIATLPRVPAVPDSADRQPVPALVPPDSSPTSAATSAPVDPAAPGPARPTAA